MQRYATLTLGALSRRLPAPVLIVSTVVGRGMYSLGEALKENLCPANDVKHAAVETMLPASAVNEDLNRYRLISTYAPLLLTLPYKVPFFYRRKLRREETQRTGTDLVTLERAVDDVRPGTVIAISHRPAFWISCYKSRSRASFELWGLLGEYGCTLGWRYIFWEQLNGFLSPVPREQLNYPFPDHLDFVSINLPARTEYHELARYPGDPFHVLLVCGFWGQGPVVRVLRSLRNIGAELRLTVICGDNPSVYQRAIRAARGHKNVTVYGVVDSLVPHLITAGSVITKPGISTLLEVHAAGRKLFLLPGMPVAEENNARYAIDHFGAEWFNEQTFASWLFAARP